MANVEQIDQPESWRDTAEPHHRLRRAKIVCTLGPASNTEAMMRDLMRLGMDVARLNFSHGTHEEHARVIERLRHVAAKEGHSICILQDLQGPKMRTGRLKQRRPVMLKAGSRITLTPRDILGAASVISTTVDSLARDVQPGMPILLSDGLIELRVKAIRGDDVECEVVNGGMLGEHKGINIPGAALSMPSMTEKDEKDLVFGLKNGVDAVAISFIRTAGDVLAVKKIVSAHHSDVPVIAKLEKPQAIEHLEEIFDVADGVMVARGDLGVEMPPEKVPVIQKHIIRRALDWRKPVITATQMLESMIENPRPTRAEASDVANAIYDGTDAVMLSGETANGKYPREAVSIMSRIIIETEAHMHEGGVRERRHDSRSLSISETICESIAHAAEDLDMRAIAVFTATGSTARLISKYRPKATIYAFSSISTVCNRLNLYWGVTPMPCQHAPLTEDMVRMAEDQLMRVRAVTPGDVMGIVAGTQRSSGSTNFMRLHVVGSADGATRPGGKEKERRRAPRLRPTGARKR
ncbi:MAG: pyruvate kinase [Acidobacteriota bacterium]|nr:pyruvate kinase [Acidobacteriota bacterium]